jgi:hypothetical protein
MPFFRQGKLPALIPFFRQFSIPLSAYLRLTQTDEPAGPSVTSRQFFPLPQPRTQTGC